MTVAVPAQTCEVSAPAPVSAAKDGMLADNLVTFLRILRDAGLAIGPASSVDCLAALRAVGVGGREDFFWVLHSVVVKRREDMVVFAEAFRQFWQPQALFERLMTRLSGDALPVSDEKSSARPASARLANAMAGLQSTRPQPESKPEVWREASAAEAFRRKDFATMTAAELLDAKRAIARLSLVREKRPTRRLTPGAGAGRPDPRRSLSDSLRRGGGIILPRYRIPRREAPPLVVLLDISGSVSRYSRVMLHLMHRIMAERRDVWCFAFATRVTDLSRHLRSRDPDEAVEACAQAVTDWEGGTRIGASLAAFNRGWGRRIPRGERRVLLVSDGLEHGDCTELSQEAARLRRSSSELTWLCPLLRYGGFQPLAAGIRALLPEVDAFRPVHSLDSLAALVAALSAPPPDPISRSFCRGKTR